MKLYQARPSALVPADLILCPRCNQPLARVTAGDGTALVVGCAHKLPAVPGARFRASCNQHLYVIGHDFGGATVIPITQSEAELLRRDGRAAPPVEALLLLGILRRRSAATVPEALCIVCETPRKRYDLFSGVCRWCR